MSDPLMTDPRLNPQDPRRTDYPYPARSNVSSAGGLLAAIAVIVIVIAIIYGLSGPRGERTGQISTPPAATRTTPPAVNPTVPPATNPAPNPAAPPTTR
jgi:hypothetical protein